MTAERRDRFQWWRKKKKPFTPQSIITSRRGQGSRFSAQHHLEVIRDLCRDKTVQIMFLWAPIKTALLFGELEKVFRLQKEGRRNNCNLHSFSPFCCKCCSVLGLARPERRGYSPRNGHVCQDNGSELIPGPGRHTCWEKKWHTSFCSAVRLAFSLSLKQKLERGKNRDCLLWGEQEEIFPALQGGQ